ncbi:pectin lyase fold/virulence factor [Amylocystis lapponica]|nr:pectin lyase fold/virulence factor [Amylocystis lapponica]
MCSLSITVLSLVSLTLSVFCSQTCAALNGSLTCILRPLGPGQDDTDQVDAAIARCGHYGTTVFESGQYNITGTHHLSPFPYKLTSSPQRRLWWDLVDARVELHGYLNFIPDIDYWLNANNTYRVVFIQDQASWFVITGHDFVVDAHWTGGIQGNGQHWWSYYGNRTRYDGDGRPIALTLYRAARATVAGFRIVAQPFWCNTVAESTDIVYDGMYCNATNNDPLYVGQNIVPNTDGIDTYRASRISLLNWDITCGDDCLAIKGNSTDVIARNITCRGGNGIAVGSLGQYVQFDEIVDRVLFENLKLIRLPANVQPNMGSGVYLKTWDGIANGTPPLGGGGGGGYVSNVLSRNVYVDRVSNAVGLYQTNGGDYEPSQLQFSNISFDGWYGTAVTNNIVSIDCSPAVPCPNIAFRNFNVTPPPGEAPRYVCVNVVGERGLPMCNATGSA